MSPEGASSETEKIEKLRSVERAVISILQHDVNADHRAIAESPVTAEKKSVPTVRIYPCVEEVRFEFHSVDTRTSQPERRALKGPATQLELGDFHDWAKEHFAKITLTAVIRRKTETIVVDLDLVTSGVRFHLLGKLFTREATSDDLQQFLNILTPMKESRGIEI